MSSLWTHNHSRSQIIFTDDEGNEFNLAEIRNEAELREKHPGLQELWEKYQMMLALCKEQNNE